MKNPRRSFWVGVLAAAAIPAVVFGADFVLPHKFVAGQTIKADEINADFDALRAEILALKNGGAASDGGSGDAVLVGAPSESKMLPLQGGGTPAVASVFVLNSSLADNHPDAVVAATPVLSSAFNPFNGVQQQIVMPFNWLYYEGGKWKCVCSVLSNNNFVPCDGVSFIVR